MVGLLLCWTKKISPRGSELCGLADLRWLSWKVRSEFFLSCLKAFKQVLIILSSSKNAVSDKYVVSSECFQATRDNLSFWSKSDPLKMLKIAKFCGISSYFLFSWVFQMFF